MGKAASDYVMDGSPSRVAEGNVMHVCSDEPADYAGIAAVSLASTALTPGDGNGDFTIADGDTSGRKVTVAQQPDIAITSSGEADHVVIADSNNARLLLVTTCDPQALTAGGTVTVPAFDDEYADPV